MRIRIILFTTVFFTVWFSGPTNAQTPPDKYNKFFEPEEAEEHFKHRNYIMAIPMFRTMVSRDQKDMNAKYKLAQCYLNTHYDKRQAIPLLEQVVKWEKAPADAWYYLGKAYHLQNKFEDAISAYEKYKDANPKDKAAVEKAMHSINQAHHGQELVKFPIHVTFTNLGPEINTEFPDYYPWVTSDEQTLFFTSRRKGGHTNSVETDGYYSSDTYMSTVLEGKWDKAKNMGGIINTSLDEEIVGIRPDGSEIVIYVDHIQEAEDLYLSVKKGNTYTKMVKMDEHINGEREYSGSMFETENGHVLLFTRKSKTGYGETDIYMCKMLPNGKWALPQNLGPKINTKYREDFPWLSVDGKTLYFSSEGHTSMGGFDLFKSVWNEETQSWSDPVNLGYPINTADDEFQISIIPDGRGGYMSAVRPEGYGDYDIYRLKFDDVEQKYSVFIGNILRPENDSSELKAQIVATNIKTKEELHFKPSHVTGRYIMALQPGIYNVSISVEGYEEITDNVIVYDFGMNRPENVKDYTLKRN